MPGEEVEGESDFVPGKCTLNMSAPSFLENSFVFQHYKAFMGFPNHTWTQERVFI